MCSINTLAQTPPPLPPMPRTPSSSCVQPLCARDRALLVLTHPHFAPTQAAARCQDRLLLMLQLFSSAEVALSCPDLLAVLAPLKEEWHRMALVAQGAGSLPPCLVALQGAEVLDGALAQVRASFISSNWYGPFTFGRGRRQPIQAARCAGCAQHSKRNHVFLTRFVYPSSTWARVGQALTLPW